MMLIFFPWRTNINTGLEQCFLLEEYFWSYWQQLQQLIQNWCYFYLKQSFSSSCQSRISTSKYLWGSWKWLISYSTWLSWVPDNCTSGNLLHQRWQCWKFQLELTLLNSVSSLYGVLSKLFSVMAWGVDGCKLMMSSITIFWTMSSMSESKTEIHSMVVLPRETSIATY